MEKKDYIIIAGVILFISLVAYGLYSYLMPMAHHPHNEEKTESDPSYELLLKSAEFLGKPEVYYLETLESTGILQKHFLITSDGNISYIRENIYGIYREVYLFNNTAIMCYDFGDERICNYANDTISRQVVDGFSSGLFSPKRAEREKKKYELLWAKGGLKIFSAEKSIANGEPCTEISFQLRYGVLPLDDMKAIGLSPSSPAISLIPYYNYTLCINDDGFILRKNVSYLYGSQQINESYVVTSYSFSSAKVPPLPKNFSSLMKGHERFAQIGREFTQCLQEKAIDDCLRDSAIHHHVARMCSYASNATRCYSAYVAFTKDASACPLLPESYRDDCYYLVATSLKNATLCQLIANETMKANCTSSLNS